MAGEGKIELVVQREIPASGRLIFVGGSPFGDVRWVAVEIGDGEIAGGVGAGGCGRGAGDDGVRVQGVRVGLDVERGERVEGDDRW
jgi:hypothetical protein